MSDIANLISQLEQQKASIDRAIEALREITNTTAAPDKPVRSAPAPESDESSDGGHITSAGRQKLAEAMKGAGRQRELRRRRPTKTQTRKDPRRPGRRLPQNGAQ